MTRRGTRLVVIVAMGFGLGLSPVASGTVGSLLGVVIALGLALAPLTWPVQAILVAGMILLAIPVCHVAEAEFGKKDDGRIVADEYVTFPLCLIGLPFTQHQQWWLLGVAFLVHRALDIWKPPPARQMQNISGGVGIVLDDVVSSLYGWGVMHAIWWSAQRLG